MDIIYMFQSNAHCRSMFLTRKRVVCDREHDTYFIENLFNFVIMVQGFQQTNNPNI